MRQKGFTLVELLVESDVPIPKIFENIGVSAEEYYNCYSWNSGTVTVPTYDSRTEAGGSPGQQYVTGGRGYCYHFISDEIVSATYNIVIWRNHLGRQA